MAHPRNECAIRLYCLFFVSATACVPPEDKDEQDSDRNCKKFYVSLDSYADLEFHLADPSYPRYSEVLKNR
jgi:hypothetical protein